MPGRSKREVAKPWTSEPDEEIFEHGGYPCVILRHRRYKHLCGYVGVPESHPLYGISYSEPVELLRPLLQAKLAEPVVETTNLWLLMDLAFGREPQPAPGEVFEVHGGLSYSGFGNHLPHPQRQNYWWFGFDCGHAGDLCPVDYGSPFHKDDVYRDINYVREQIKLLAEQLKSVESLRSD